jgi:catechol 2,3-dioxygenase-like lactoylglutathione lyase family enzyme
VVLFAGIHHVSLNVSDTERALGFYRDVLGMRELPRPPFPFGGAWLDAGEGRQVHLIEADVPPDVGQHVAFGVESIEHTIAVLREAGVEVDDARKVADTGIRQTFVVDPDGNRVEFTQPG